MRRPTNKLCLGVSLQHRRDGQSFELLMRWSRVKFPPAVCNDRWGQSQHAEHRCSGCVDLPSPAKGGLLCFAEPDI